MPRFQSLGREDALEEGMAIRYSILVWRILWTEGPGGLQSIGSQRVGHNLVTKITQGMAIHSSILVWRILGTEEPGGLQSLESQRVGND